MIQAEVIAFDFLLRLSQGEANAEEQFGGSVADTDDAHSGVRRNCLGDDSSGVRKIYDPCLRSEPFHKPRMFKRYWNRSAGHRETTWPCSFLAREAEFQLDLLITVEPFQP